MKGLIATLVAAAPLAMAGAQTAPAPGKPATVTPAGRGLFDNIINKPGIGWEVYGANQAAKQVAVTAASPGGADVPGGVAVRIAVSRPGAHVYDVGAGYPTSKPIAKGDTVVMLVFMRAPDVKEGATIPIPVGIGEAAAPYAQVANETVQVGSTWKRYFVAGVSPKAFGVGQARISIQLGGAKQVVELGAGFLLDPGPGFDMAKLPRG